MYTLNNYVNDIFLLTNSLVVKIEDAATAINTGLYYTNGINVGSDKTQWKYYMNIAGEKHFTNSTILVYVPELDTQAELTKDVLVQYPSLQLELIKQGSAYENLISTYPNDEAYIKGMLFPVDINTAINADDGTILSYNNTFIASNEISIITELELKIKNFLSRWHNREYMITDELYLAGMLAVLYSNIPNMIINIKLSKINTSEVDRFHLEHFFRSNLDLWDDVQVLDQKSLIWLYHNLKYLMANVGREETLQIIIDKIFTENSIGIGHFELYKEDVSFKTNAADGTALYDTPKTKLITKKLNNRYVNNDSLVYDIYDVVSMQIDTDITLETDIMKDANTFYANAIANNLASTNFDMQQTKILDLETPNLFKFYATDIGEIVLDSLVYDIFNDRFDKTITYVDPNTLIIYTLTTKQAFYFILKMLMNITGDSSVLLSNYNYTTIVNHNLTIDELTAFSNATSISPVDNTYIIETLQSYLPTSYSDNYTVASYGKYIDEVINFYVIDNILSTNVNNVTQAANIEALNNYIINRGSVNITGSVTPVDIDTILKTNGIELSTNASYDYSSSITALVYSLTGVNVDIYAGIDNIITSFIKILNKLTSYTTQIIKKPEDSDYLYTKYIGTNVTYATNGIINVIDAEILYNGLEQELTTVNAIGNNFEDIIFGSYNFNSITVTDVTNLVNQHTVMDTTVSMNFTENSVGYQLFNNVYITKI